MLSTLVLNPAIAIPYKLRKVSVGSVLRCATKMPHFTLSHCPYIDVAIVETRNLARKQNVPLGSVARRPLPQPQT